MPISRSARRRGLIAITLGDAAGIGPEVTVKAIPRLPACLKNNILLLGPVRVFESRATRLRPKIHFEEVSDPTRSPRSTGAIACYFPWDFPKSYRLGAYNKHLCAAAINSIRLAAALAQRGMVQAMVTAPINKASMSRAGMKVPGHTELLGVLSQTKKYEMMLVGGPLRVVLVTRHLALAKAAASLNQKRIVEAILTTDHFLRNKLGIRRPKLAVCALNPHAGENGHFGQEEIKVIGPAVAAAGKRTNAHLFGPLPADVLFRQAYLGRYDAQICMYHDQGQIPLKMISRGSGVNVTLGLPFVRTSPDHGTGYDIARLSKADPGSMIEAISLARRLSAPR